MEKKRLSIDVTAEQAEQLEKLAKEQMRSVKNLLEWIVANHLGSVKEDK